MTSLRHGSSGAVRLTAAEQFLDLGSGVGWDGWVVLWLSVSNAGPGCGCCSLDALRVENGGPDFFGRFLISDAIHGSLDWTGPARSCGSASRTLRRLLSLGPWPETQGLARSGPLAAASDPEDGVPTYEVPIRPSSLSEDAQTASLTAHCTDRAPRILAGPRIPDIVINHNLEWVESPKTGA
jgi:hypothetical protein